MQTAKDNRNGGFEGAGYKLFNGPSELPNSNLFSAKLLSDVAPVSDQRLIKHASAYALVTAPQDICAQRAAGKN